jgi:hypothetical protein
MIRDYSILSHQDFNSSPKGTYKYIISPIFILKQKYPPEKIKCFTILSVHEYPNKVAQPYTSLVFNWFVGNEPISVKSFHAL